VVEEGVVVIDKTTEKKNQEKIDNIGKNNSFQEKVMRLRDRKDTIMKRRSNMKVTMKRWMVITNNMLKIIGDGRTIIVSKTIKIRRVTVIKSSVIDKNIQTKKPMTGNKGVNTSPKRPTKTERIRSRKGSKKKRAISKQMMTLADKVSLVKTVRSTLLKTKIINRRMLIKVTKRCNRKWRILQRSKK